MSGLGRTRVTVAMNQRVGRSDALSTRDAARLLRRNQTAAEQRLWAHLRKRQVDGLRFRRQVACGSFIADFYCPQARLIVEVDGAVHDRPDQRLHDRDRDAALREVGLTILRITNDEVFADIESVLARIHRAARDLGPTETSAGAGTPGT